MLKQLGAALSEEGLFGLFADSYAMTFPLLAEL